MRVRYQAVSGKLEPYYICTENAVRRADNPASRYVAARLMMPLGALILDSRDARGN